MKAKGWSSFLVLYSLAALSSGLPAQTEAVQLARRGDTVEVVIGGQPFTTYHFGPQTAKAYLFPLRTADDVVVSRDFPVLNAVPAEHLHDPGLEPHQRPLYFGHGSIDGYNFWAEEVFAKYYPPNLGGKFGHMAFRRLDRVRSGPSSGSLQATFDLLSRSNETLGEEVQAFTFRGDKKMRIVDCEFVVRAMSKPLTFGDTKEGAFAVRLAAELDAPAGTMVDSKGRKGEAEIWGKQADWVDVSGRVAGETVGVAIFDHPKSFRHPTYWHARGYGLLAANPFGLSYFLKDTKQDGSYTVPAGESIRFLYRVVIHQGDAEQANIAERYREYTVLTNR